MTHEGYLILVKLQVGEKKFCSLVMRVKTIVVNAQREKNN